MINGRNAKKQTTEGTCLFRRSAEQEEEIVAHDEVIGADKTLEVDSMEEAAEILVGQSVDNAKKVINGQEQQINNRECK